MMDCCPGKSSGQFESSNRSIGPCGARDRTQAITTRSTVSPAADKNVFTFCRIGDRRYEANYRCASGSVMKKQPSISPVMRDLSAYIVSAPRRALPPAVREKTKHHVLDTIAAMISGSRLKPGMKAISYVKT